MNLCKKLLLGIGITTISLANAQDLSQIRPVLTGAPFLRIAPDARSGGLGDQGVVTSPDVFSQYWNAAKYPFSRQMSGVGINYTPYLGKLTNDVFLLYASYYKLLGGEERSSFSTSLYYFNMGEVQLSQLGGTANTIIDMGTAKPNEFSLDMAYALRLADTFSMAVTGRFIRSDLAGGFNTNTTLKPANSFALDISSYFSSPRFTGLGNLENKLNAGLSIQNMGPKLDYTGDDQARTYLPTMARLGLGYEIFLDDLNKVTLSGEASKILVPGREILSYNARNEPIYGIPNVGLFEGITKSFKNEKSIMYSGAAEYNYDNTFMLRGGYFHESELQGSRQFATAGVGIKYNSFQLDVSYLINVSKVNTALDNTLRFGLTWNIGDESMNANDY